MMPYIIAALLLAALPVQAGLLNRYSLNGDGTDSVGGQAGTLTGSAVFTATSLLTGGASLAGLSLPPTIGAGLTADFSIELYATQTAASPFAST